ncbi:MAG: RHS repeat-associated core domain-containing protein, partial [Methylotenera sp.]
MHTVSYSYNSFGQLTGQTTPSNQLIGYSYDTQGRVNSITLNGQYLLSNLQYQPFGIPKSWTWGNGQVYQRYFDSDGRLTDYPVGTNYRYIAIDQANNIRGYYHWPNDVGRNRNFTYDELDRLTGFLDGDVTNKRYQYDANGNRTSISFLGQTPLPYTIAANSNRLLGQTSPSVKSFSYDAAGNTISDGSSSLTWNAAGRLKTVTAGTNVNSYLYNGNGERLIKTGAFLSSAPHRFVYDGAGHLIGEYDSNNALREETLWLGDTPVAVIQRDPATGLNQTYYVHSDHLNTPKVLLNSANVPVWRSDNSDAFGAGLPVQDPDADGKAVEYNLRFPGQYYDTETGLHYNYFRDYNPSTGRYVQSDP